MRNEGIRFIDKWIECEAQEDSGRWGLSGSFKLPIAHGEGRFFTDQESLKEMKANGQIWLTYKDNPNGSVEDIAGVLNKEKNVAALMPHPERAVSSWMGGTDGQALLERFL
jgi:phosphoribosylformylglycinamidine synthase